MPGAVVKTLSSNKAYIVPAGIGKKRCRLFFVPKAEHLRLAQGSAVFCIPFRDSPGVCYSEGKVLNLLGFDKILHYINSAVFIISNANSHMSIGGA